MTKPITVTVTGSNDAVEITSDAQTAAIAELAGTHGSATPDTASGAITFADVDLTDTHEVTITGVHASGVMTGLADDDGQLGWLSLGPSGRFHRSASPGSQSWSFSAPDQLFRLSCRWRDRHADLHGKGRRPPWRRHLAGRSRHRQRQQRRAEIATIAQQGLTEQTDTSAADDDDRQSASPISTCPMSATAQRITHAAATGTTHRPCARRGSADRAGDARARDQGRRLHGRVRSSCRSRRRRPRSIIWRRAKF